MSPSSSAPWLVTGAAGFLGSHLVEQLLNQGIPVVAVDSLIWGDINHLRPLQNRPGFSLAIADIRDASAMKSLLAATKPTAVVHLAALHYIPAASADPPLAIAINVLGTQNMLTASMAAGVSKFWFASTGDVYAPASEAHREDHSITPFNVYGLSKLQGEQLIELTARSFPEVAFVVGRLFNLYGTHETNPHILPEILKQLRADPDKPLRLGNLFPKRDLVPVTEAAKAVIAMVQAAQPGVTTANVATGEARSMHEVIEMLGVLRGKPIAVETDPAKVRPVERNHLQANVTKLKAMIGWTPHPDLRRGLAELLAAEPI